MVDGTRLVWAAGRSELGEVTVEFKGGRYPADVVEHGLWVWTARDDNDGSEALPRPVGPR
jgi:hypothetical protein